MKRSWRSILRIKTPRICSFPLHMRTIHISPFPLSYWVCLEIACIATVQLGKYWRRIFTLPHEDSLNPQAILAQSLSHTSSRHWEEGTDEPQRDKVTNVEQFPEATETSSVVREETKPERLPSLNENKPTSMASADVDSSVRSLDESRQEAPETSSRAS